MYVTYLNNVYPITNFKCVQANPEEVTYKPWSGVKHIIEFTIFESILELRPFGDWYSEVKKEMRTGGAGAAAALKKDLNFNDNGNYDLLCGVIPVGVNVYKDGSWKASFKADCIKFNYLKELSINVLPPTQCC